MESNSSSLLLTQHSSLPDGASGVLTKAVFDLTEHLLPRNLWGWLPSFHQVHGQSLRSGSERLSSHLPPPTSSISPTPSHTSHTPLVSFICYHHLAVCLVSCSVCLFVCLSVCPRGRESWKAGLCGAPALRTNTQLTVGTYECPVSLGMVS